MKNQFRSLDEDEVEFLDSVLESTRTQEAAIKKETNEQLELFQRQRQEADQALLDTSTGGKTGETNAAGAGSPTEEETWATTNRKRRRAKEKEPFRGVKLRKASSSGAKRSPSQDTKPSGGDGADKSTKPTKTEDSTTTRKPSGSAQSLLPIANEEDSDDASSPGNSTEPKKPAIAAPSALGLGAYSSDED